MRVRRSAILILAALLVMLVGCEQVSTPFVEGAPSPGEPGVSPAVQATFGGIVWEDLDRDGWMEEAEPPMAGVPVELLDATMASFDPAVLTVTGEDGRYVFEELEAGTYFVAFSRPEGYEFSRPDRGDSDASLVTGIAGPIELASVALTTQGTELGDVNAGASVAAIVVPDNPSCATLNGMNDTFPSIVSDFGFKVEGGYNRTVLMDGGATGTTLTGGAPADPVNTVTLSSTDGIYLDWSATLAMDAVIVKASTDGNVYVYTPEAFFDSGLHGPINPKTNMPYAISHVEFCYDYALEATKTATAEYTRTYTWTIDKTVDPASHVGWAGESFGWDYAVELDRTVTDDDFAVSGEIVVTNPTPFAVDFTVTDVVGGVSATVTCPATTLAAGGSVTCAYSAGLASKTDGTNTVTVTSVNPYVLNTTATADYAFGDPTSVDGYETVTVTDYYDGDAVGVPLGSSADSLMFEYDNGEACPTDDDLYENGVYHGTIPNYAEIDQTGQQDDASVELTCYMPTVTKTATATYVERHDWSLAKKVTPASQSGFIGDRLEWTWTIVVGETVVDQEFLVTGTISVTNPSPAPVDALVSDFYGATEIEGAVDCDAETPGDQSTLTIPASSTGTCTYVVAAQDASPAVNSAVVLLRGREYVAPVDVTTFGKIVENDSATLSDPTLGVDSALDGAYEDSFTGTHDCSKDRGDYGDSGSYNEEVVNTATLVDAEGKAYAASTKTSYTCYLPAITKTAAGSYDERHEWTVEKSVSPLSQSAFFGDTVDFYWSINVTDQAFEENFAVAGTITVSNPNPEDALIVPLTDFVDGVAASIIGTGCAFDGTNLTVAAGGSETCAYRVDLAEDTVLDTAPTLNTAAIVLNGETFEAQATIGYTPNVIRGAVTLDDDRYPFAGQVIGNSWGFEYVDSYTCSTNEGDYTNGVDADNRVSNTAEIFSEAVSLGSSTATTEIDCYLPAITKTAAGSYDERHEWTVEKTAMPASQSAFIGETVYFDWVIEVFEDVFEENFDVFGTITVTNPNPEDALKVELADHVGEVAATIDTSSCAFDGTYLEVAAGGTETCEYEANDLAVDSVDEAPGTNTAEMVLNGRSFFATDPIEYAPNVIRGTATLDDEQFPYSGEAVHDGWNMGYEDAYTCSTDEGDYSNGVDADNVLTNTARVFSDGVEQDASTAQTRIDCYKPIITKTAAGTYDERHEWYVTKTVDQESQSAFFGDSVKFTWTILVTEEMFEENFAVAGTITVSNPNPERVLEVSLTDLVGSVPATIDTDSCDIDGTNVTVAAGGFETCDYTASLAGILKLADAPPLNTAKIVLNEVELEATATIWYTANVIRGTATLNDDRFELSGEAVYDGWNMEVRDGYTCSTNEADYTDGVDAGNLVSNTAEVFSGGDLEDSSTATTEIDCYKPVVTKTASASYVERHTWDVEKTVTPLDQRGYPGDELDWTWTVTVSETYVEEDFHVSGTISVMVPEGAPDPVKLGITDQLDDGTFATVDCGAGETTLMVSPGTTATCDYDAYPSGRTAMLNTATAASVEFDFAATAPVSFVRTVKNGSATVADDEIGLSATLSAGAGPWTYTGDDKHVCSSWYTDYGEDGSYSAKIDNTAIVTASDGQSDSAMASTSYMCEAGTLKVLKLTNGQETVNQNWTFEVYEGPDGFSDTPLYSDMTPPALIDFGAPALRLDTIYTLCEVDVPAGYSSFWQLGGATLIPYNPNADDDPPEDLGNRCVDFTPSYAGDAFAFVVDNRMPGGDPRTPGYWKNWNTCTGGGQQYTAAANGGWQEGFWLLENVLDPNIGGGITWDDILTDGFLFQIGSCEVAVDILDKRLVGDPAIVADGKKNASDPLVNLATHLLAAQLNFGAGACTTQEVLDAALAAERLLDEYDYNGNTHIALKKRDSNAQVANDLANYLDQYNNGGFCGSTME